MPARVYATCILTDCDRPHYGKGLCHLHYQRKYRTGETNARTRKSRGQCSIKGCDRLIRGRGLCAAHYMRWYSGSENTNQISPVRGTVPEGVLPNSLERREWLIYAAGFFDGEGCISIIRSGRHRRYWLNVTAAQIDRAPLRLLQTLFGGCLKTHGQQANRPVSAWVATCRQGAAALRELEPFLIVKRRQAQLALMFQNTMTSDHKVTDAILETRERLCREMTAQKHRKHVA